MVNSAEITPEDWKKELIDLGFPLDPMVPYDYQAIYMKFSSLSELSSKLDDLPRLLDDLLRLLKEHRLSDDSFKEPAHLFLYCMAGAITNFDTIDATEAQEWLEIAAICGNLPLVRYLYTIHKLDLSADFMNYAALSGNLNLVQYLYLEGCPNLSEMTLDWAKLSRNSEVIDYLHHVFKLEVEQWSSNPSRMSWP